MANMVNNKLYFQDTKTLKDCLENHFKLEDKEYIFINNNDLENEPYSIDIDFNNNTMYFESDYTPPFELLNELGKEYEYDFIAMGDDDLTEEFWDFSFTKDNPVYNDDMFHGDPFEVAFKFNRLEDLEGYEFDEDGYLEYTGENSLYWGELIELKEYTQSKQLEIKENKPTIGMLEENNMKQGQGTKLDERTVDRINYHNRQVYNELKEQGGVSTYFKLADDIENKIYDNGGLNYNLIGDLDIVEYNCTPMDFANKYEENPHYNDYQTLNNHVKELQEDYEEEEEDYDM